MTSKAKVKSPSKANIISYYMNYVLEHEAVPKSVFKFCKENKIKEEEFYKNFGSVKGIQKAIWDIFFENTMDLLSKNKEYQEFSSKDKMLTFFFTFFEMLKLNRSYVLFALNEDKNPLKSIEQLKGLRNGIRNFTKELIEEDNSVKTSKISKHQPGLFSEGAWVQFLFLLKFWMDDTSADFEKTDIAIEKSIKTIFDVFDNTPLDSIIDFGKFIYKEKFS
ncbi:MAG: TetR family transcriptional regulator C-terminal domain-containing protein [Eudoraea sp.]|uniref:TetR family transcriptional regulator C-terminal domain-containing protein n=1 Tax=Eudoraea sp. TaxID=1979955 RepID=UPI003C70F92F